jgi:prepilin signal peptidase PulO-like enzyme (type II secretory pathway)
MMKLASPFGLIWAGFVIASGMVANVGLEAIAALHSQDAAKAEAAWVAIGAVQDGLGGGVEMVGGLWVILVSIASLRTSALPSMLGYLGLAIGAAGILTIAPVLRELGAAFGLGQIFWFAWLGVLMLRREAGTARARSRPVEVDR